MPSKEIRKTIGRQRDLSVFGRIRKLNAELDRLGIPSDREDHLVRKVFGKPRRLTIDLDLKSPPS